MYLGTVHFIYSAVMANSEINFYTASASLAEKDHLDVEGMKLIYQLEVSGEVFYNLLADRVGNDEAADLLRKNAIEERGHARRLARAISLKLGSEWEPAPENEVVLAIPLPNVVTAELFAAIVQGEINGDAGYQKWADNETDEEVVRLLRLNGREETIHAGRAQQVFELLSAS